ncbi:transaldolase/EF-hand domain-containing protein [Posidoniimonas polymericola]|uniref:Transaldolase/EF-hand domain-containing protein n=1 Tax=Posidoniimonas polymericola TaxID=2528002 RepID=A0A5C5YRV7_9BACT|nr:hypothetical protein [Posidoniimonas polymericola]TWT77460.1 transaldolase/EF-hand domain-containing protein [Posidoniimonas polymericola]
MSRSKLVEVGPLWVGLVLALSLAPSQARAGEAADDLFARLDANGDQLLDPAEVASEHQRLFERLLRKADQNGDGRLTAAEFAAGLTPSTPPKPIVDEPADSTPATDALRLLLLKLDTDRDAMLTRDEAPAELREAFDQLARAADGDQNGQIAYRELVQGGRRASQTAVRIARQEGWDVERQLRRLDAEQGAAAKRFSSQPNPREALASPRRTQEMFKQLDANRDGRVALDEVPEQARDRVERLLRAADRDRSGDVTLEEFQRQAQRAARFAGMAEGDSPRLNDRPGNEDPDAMRRERGRMQAEGGGAMQRMLRQLDANNDRMISREEAAGVLERRFDRLDANGNGQLDADELGRTVQQLQRRTQMNGRRPGGRSDGQPNGPAPADAQR